MVPQKDDILALLVKFDERQRTIFKTLTRVENHLAKLNSKVAEHERTLIELRTIGTVAVLIIPVIVSYVMRYFN
tara:strand:- start:1961 stop:2182 length:222 start_codon:yes stop_codon:yes gene_type:complete